MKRVRLIDVAKESWIKKNRAGNTAVPNHIVIKVTPLCNMKCMYCYSNNNEARQSFIDPYYVASLLEQIFSIGSTYKVRCVFHGGEPMLGMNIITKTIDILKNKYYYDRIEFHIQTNGTLISQNNIEYLEKIISSVGISLDGVGHINDLTRKFINDNGTFSAVEESINLLKMHNIPFGVLSVATKYNIEYLKDFVSWCAEHDIYSIGIEPLLLAGRGAGCKDLIVTPEKYWFEMKKVLDYVIDYNKKCPFDQRILIRDFETVARKIMNKYCKNMCSEVPCGAGREHITLNYDGKVYICDTFTDNTKYCIGDIQIHHIKEMLESPILSEFYQRSLDNNRICNRCSMRKYCLVGCIGKTMMETGENDINARSTLCYYYHNLAEYLLEKHYDGLDMNLLANL